MQTDNTHIQPTNPVVEGEVVDDTTQGGGSSDNAGQVLASMENLIKTHQLKIEETQNDLKKHNDMLNDVLLNEPDLQQVVAEAKEVNKRKNAIKQQILTRPQNADLANKVKTMRSELKNLKDALSDYLGEYARMSGTNVVEGYDGELREIVYVAKLVRRSGRDQSRQ